MATNDAPTVTAETCPWCGRPLAGEPTETVGPPPHLGDRHAFEFHESCVPEWKGFVERARTLAARGGREALLSYPLSHGTDRLTADDD